jgi:hypothetical protein
MVKFTMIGLFTVSVVSLLWTEATAGCRRIPQPNGTVICASYTRGSIKAIVLTNVPKKPTPGSAEINKDSQVRVELSDIEGQVVCKKSTNNHHWHHGSDSERFDFSLEALAATKDVKCLFTTCVAQITFDIGKKSCPESHPVHLETIVDSFDAVARACEKPFKIFKEGKWYEVFCPAKEISIEERCSGDHHDRVFKCDEIGD